MVFDRVMEMLKAYRFEVGRCGHIQAEIGVLRRLKRQMELDLTTAMVAPKPQEITDMPHGTQVGNPTERYALRLVEGLQDKDLQEIEAKIAKLQAEYDDRHSTVEYVSSWLSGLPERERWVVETQVIDGVFWRDVLIRYRQQFGIDASKDTLQRVKAKAMESIYEMAQ